MRLAIMSCKWQKMREIIHLLRSCENYVLLAFPFCCRLNFLLHGYRSREYSIVIQLVENTLALDFAVDSW